MLVKRNVSFSLDLYYTPLCMSFCQFNQVITHNPWWEWSQFIQSRKKICHAHSYNRNHNHNPVDANEKQTTSNGCDTFGCERKPITLPPFHANKNITHKYTSKTFSMYKLCTTLQTMPIFKYCLFFYFFWETWALSNHTYTCIHMFEKCLLQKYSLILEDEKENGWGEMKSRMG